MIRQIFMCNARNLLDLSNTSVLTFLRFQLPSLILAQGQHDQFFFYNL